MSNTATSGKARSETFEKWMTQLNRRLSMLIGFTTDDLTDRMYYDCSSLRSEKCRWRDRYSIEDAIAELAAEEGFEELL